MIDLETIGRRADGTAAVLFEVQRLDVGARDATAVPGLSGAARDLHGFAKLFMALRIAFFPLLEFGRYALGISFALAAVILTLLLWILLAPPFVLLAHFLWIGFAPSPDGFIVFLAVGLLPVVGRTAMTLFECGIRLYALGVSTRARLAVAFKADPPFREPLGDVPFNAGLSCVVGLASGLQSGGSRYDFHFPTLARPSLAV